MSALACLESYEVVQRDYLLIHAVIDEAQNAADKRATSGKAIKAILHPLHLITLLLLTVAKT